MKQTPVSVSLCIQAHSTCDVNFDKILTPSTCKESLNHQSHLKQTGGLKFLISRKVWYSLEMRKLICIPLLNNWGAFWLQTPFSQKSYSLDSMHAKTKIIIEGCPYCLHVSLELFFRIPYFTSYTDVNCLPLKQMCNNLCVLWVT